MTSSDGQSEREIDKLGILALVLSRGLTQLPSSVVGLLLVDIASSFNVQVGAAGQISTASGLFSIFFGLLMGVLSVRFKHKSLLFMGILLYIVSALASFFSTSLFMLMGVYSLVGIANAIVIPMVNSLIGDLVPPDRRTSVIGLTVAGMSILFFIATLSAGFLSNMGWKMIMVLVIVPVGVLTSILCRSGIPDQRKSSENQASLGDLFSGYMNLLRNKSAIGCILGTSLGFSTWYYYLVYGASFFRQRFLMSPSSISVVLIFITLSFIIGSLMAGRLVKRTSEKTTLLIFTAFLGIITLFVFRTSTFWFSFLPTLIAGFSAGAMITVSSSFALMQIPEYRGTMMSLHSAADSLGWTISAGLGGTLLLVYGYGLGSMVVGALGILGAVILLVLTSDP